MSTGIGSKTKTLGAFVTGILLITVNILRVIGPIKGISFNVALSDFIAPLMVLLLFVNAVLQKNTRSIRYWQWGVLLFGWLVLSNQLATKNAMLLVASPGSIYGEWLKMLICITYFYIGYQVLQYITLGYFLRFYAIGYGIFLIYGFGTMIALSKGIRLPYIQDNASRFFLGTYHDPNHAATYIAISFYVLMFMAHKENSIMMKVAIGILALISVPALILTDSRGGLLAFVCALILYAMIMYYSRLSSLISLGMLLLLSLISGLLFDSTINEGKFIQNLFNSFMNFDQGMNIRDGLRQTAWYMGLDHWLFGVGRGNYLANSAVYFERLDIKFIDNIPHNTYVGLLAETGIVGLVLYSIPLALIIRQLFRHRSVVKAKWIVYKPFIAVFLASLTVLGIQAYVLNIENRRTYWLLAGIVLWLLEEQFESIAVPVTKYKERKRWLLGLNSHSVINILLAISCLLIFLVSINNIHMPKKERWSSGTISMELPIPTQLKGEVLELEYYLYANQAGLIEQETLKVRIIEVANGDESVIASYTYPRTNGTCRLNFEQLLPDSDVYVEVSNISEELRAYRFWPKRLISDNYVIDLTRNYYLAAEKNQVNSMESSLDVRDDELYALKNFNPKLEDFDGTVMSDLIEIEALFLEETTNGVQLRVSYLALEDIDKDYNIYLYGNPENLNYLDRSRYLSNNEYYNPIEAFLTSGWVKGGRYEVIYPLPRDYGWYRFISGIYYKENSETEWLIDSETNRNYVVFGWADLSTVREK